MVIDSRIIHTMLMLQKHSKTLDECQNGIFMLGLILQIGIFSPVKYFTYKFFTQSNFRHQTLATNIGIGRRTLHKIFCVFNFRRKRRRQKYFNDENFAIYGIIRIHKLYSIITWKIIYATCLHMSTQYKNMHTSVKCKKRPLNKLT